MAERNTGRSARSAAKPLTARPTPPTPTSGRAMAERNTGRSARSAAKPLTARPMPPTPMSGRATGTSTGRSARTAAKSLTARPILTTKIRASAPFAGILARSSRMKICPNSRTALLPKRNPSSKNEKTRGRNFRCALAFFSAIEAEPIQRTATAARRLPFPKAAAPPPKRPTAPPPKAQKRCCRSPAPLR